MLNAHAGWTFIFFKASTSSATSPTAPKDIVSSGDDFELPPPALVNGIS